MSHFKAKMHQIRLHRSPDSLAGFKGPTSKGTGGREEGKAGEGKGRGKKGREGKDGKKREKKEKWREEGEGRGKREGRGALPF